MLSETFQLALSQMSPSVGDSQNNLDAAVAAIESAKSQNCELVVLPEFFNTGYFPIYWDYRHMDLAEPLTGPSLTRIAATARSAAINVVACIYEVDGPGNYFDTSVLINAEGDIVGRYRKTHAPARISLEKLYFRPAAAFPTFRLGEWTIGMTICYDTYFPESVRCLAVAGATLVAVPYADVELPLWTELFQVRAFENLLYVAVCNTVGGEGTDPVMEFGGRSLVADPLGNLLALAGASSPEVVIAEVSLSRVYEARKARHLWRDRNPGAYRAIVETDPGVGSGTY